MLAMVIFLARQRCSLSRPDQPFRQVCKGKDSLYVFTSPHRLHTGVYPSILSMSSSVNTECTHTHTDAIERFRNETLRVYGVLEIHLSGKYTGEPRDYLAGSGKGKYSVADIGTWPWVKGYSFSGFSDEDVKPFPHLLKWIDRIAERPAVKRGTGDAYRPS